MAEAGTVAVKRVNGRKSLYAVTTSNRITRGLTLRELQEAYPSLNAPAPRAHARISEG
jgi:hypothetical protein